MQRLRQRHRPDQGQDRKSSTSGGEDDRRHDEHRGTSAQAPVPRDVVAGMVLR
jgi:hypothetical protein